MGIYRPAGVIAFAIILFILAGLGIIAGILYFIQPISPEVNLNLELISFYNWIYTYYAETGYYPMGLFTLGGMEMNLYERYDLIFYFKTVASMGLILSVVNILSGYGLLQMKNWGRYLALLFGFVAIFSGIIFLALSVIGMIPSYLFPVHLVPLIFGIVLIVYMLGDVKNEFQ